MGWPISPHRHSKLEHSRPHFPNPETEAQGGAVHALGHTKAIRWSADSVRAARPQAPFPNPRGTGRSGLAASSTARADLFTRRLSWPGLRPACPQSPRELASLAWGSRNPERPRATRSRGPTLAPVGLGLLRRLQTEDALRPGGRHAHPASAVPSRSVASPIPLRSREPGAAEPHPSFASQGLTEAVTPAKSRAGRQTPAYWLWLLGGGPRPSHQQSSSPQTCPRPRP